MTAALRLLADPAHPVPTDLATATGAAQLRAFVKEVGPDALPTLRRLLDHPNARLNAIDALGGLTIQEAADLLAPLAEDADKAVRKAARQALHRLKSANVVPGAPKTMVSPAEGASPVAAALASTFDGGFNRLLRFYLRRPFGAIREAVVRINGLQGVQDVRVTDLAAPLAKHLADAQAAASPDGAPSLQWGALPPEYAATLLREAMAQNTAAGTGLPSGFVELRDALAMARPDPTPLIYSFVRPIEVMLDPAALAESDEILAGPEFDLWGFDDDAVAPYLAEVARARRADVMLGARSRQMRLAAVLDRAHQELITPAIRPALRRQLEETAYTYWSAQRVRDARRAVAAARAFTETPTGESPFSRALVARSVLAAERAARPAAERSRRVALWTP